MPGSAPKEHRGRVQAQGPRVEESERWELDAPPLTSHGHALLQTLRNKLEHREQKERAQAFEQAHQFVNTSADQGGLPQDGRYPVAKTFPRPPRRDQRRVDIEIHAGRAFIHEVP